MKNFLKYLKTKRRVAAVFVVFSVVFAVSFFLYRLPLRAAVYPVALCFFIGAAVTVSGYLKFRKRQSALNEISLMTSEMIASLPEGNDGIEEEYRRIILALRNENTRLMSESTDKLRDMTEYYSVWAHQIKTPIASMKLTLQGEDTPTARKLLAELQRIEQYVEMVLAFIRLDSSSTDYVFKEYSVDEILRQSVRRFAPDFIGRKIRLEYEPLNETVLTDEKWFAFVVEQILSNSLKYTKQGAVRIYKTEDRRLCIEDTGIGIAPEDLPRIFENGYTGFNGRADKSASGIGLYLCRRICANLGLGIEAESEPGAGTKIYIDLKQNRMRHE